MTSILSTIAPAVRTDAAAVAVRTTAGLPSAAGAALKAFFLWKSYVLTGKRKGIHIIIIADVPVDIVLCCPISVRELSGSLLPVPSCVFRIFPIKEYCLKISSLSILSGGSDPKVL